MVFAHEDISLDSTKVDKLLSIKEKGYAKKKSEIFDRSQIESFLDNAPSETFLNAKAVMVLGVYGCLRSSEIINITSDDIKKDETGYRIFVAAQKSTETRYFRIEGRHATIIDEYDKLRPMKATSRFLLTSRKGTLVNSPLGINQIGLIARQVATFLRLLNPDAYTGHCFRRTSATLAANSGIDFVQLKRLGGWKSDTVAQHYIAESSVSEVKRAKIINGNGAKEIKNLEVSACSISGDFHNCQFVIHTKPE